jgi:eukaryotic-like serine/threonine-protein kinase
MTRPRLVGGRYELDGIVGRGGMAEVFRARDIRLDRLVGVKTLRNELLDDETCQTRFRREAQSAASLNHPSIVAVYDTGEDVVGGTTVPYIVMEFVEGRTLRDLVSDGGPLAPERAAEITDGVLQALDYSHRNGIVHRDIKPGNIMVTPSGAVKVMDFGLARAISEDQLRLTMTAQVMGTAHYLSPEQARGERVDARSDLYSTGCLLYELLTGQPPFSGDSPMAVVYQHVKADPVPPSQIRPEVPAWADALVLTAMQKDRAQRYSSAGQMRHAIQRALAGGPEPAPRRHAWPWVTLAVVIVLLGGAIAGITLLTGSNKGVGVPTVTGLSLVNAENAIAGAGLRVGSVARASSGLVAENDVISTNPSYGTLVSKGSAVNFVVSTGPVPLASHPRRLPGHPATPKPRALSSPGQGGPVPSSPVPSASASPSSSVAPKPAGPSPSPSCVLNILRICV